MIETVKLLHSKTGDYNLGCILSTPVLPCKSFFMKLTTKEIKQRHYDKVYNNAEIVSCACWCWEQIKNKDKYWRDSGYVNWHGWRKYKDKKQYKRERNKRNKKYRKEKNIERGRRLKAKVVKDMWWKCECCWLVYDWINACVFQMHHINPKDKVIVVNTRTLVTYARKKIEKEIIKCFILCANCHSLYHNAKY